MWPAGARPRPLPAAASARGAWVRAEVDVLEPVGREVGVDLGGGEIGVAEHLLQRAQIASAGEQVGGEGVSERVRAHPLLEPGAAGMRLDDLVEALARQPAAAEIEEQGRVHAVYEQQRP